LVIAAMLIASGAGSYYSSRLQFTRSALSRILMLITSLLLLFALFLSPFLQSISGWPAVAKLVVSFVVITFPSFLMGMPFPTGLRLLSRLEGRNTAWAWGINGCISVISASLAAILAVEAGFKVMVFVAALAYLGCFFSFYLLPISKFK